MHVLRRRHFLSLAGAGLIAAPFVNLLRTRRVRAADGVAKRLIVFFSPDGIVHSHWRPSGGGSDFSFPAGSILEPLTPHKDNLIVMDGINFFQADNHEGGMEAMLTCKGGADSVGGGASIDQFVANQLASQTKFKSLELGIATSAWGGSNQTRMCYSAPGQFVTPDDDPLNVYDRMFGDLAGGEEAANKLRNRRQRVVDLLEEETKALREEVGTEERYKLDAHLEALAAVEQGIQAGGSCGEPPEAPSISNPKIDASIPAVTKAQIDLAVVGLACGLTNVVTIQLSHTVSPSVFSWLDGVNEGHHSLSHIDDSNTAGVAKFAACERWSAEQFAYLLTQLSEMPEPGGEGTMLDNSVVLWAKEMGDSRAHVCTDVPFVLAGGSNCFNTGQYLSFEGEPHNKLMVSICHAMGLSNDSFGDASFGTGPLPGIAS